MRSSRDSQTYIFEISAEQCVFFLKNPGQWLIRDSVSQPGLLVLSIRVDDNIIKHRRFGLAESGWEMAPFPLLCPTAPTDTFDVMAQLLYQAELKAYQRAMQAIQDFNQHSNQLFDQPGFVENHSEGLLPLLLRQEFSTGNEIIVPALEEMRFPDPQFQTKHSRYAGSYSLVDVQKLNRFANKLGSIKSLSLGKL